VRFLLALQNPQPMIVQIVPEPARQTTLADVLIGALGITGLLVLAAVLAGALLAVVLLRWNRRHPPQAGHLPPVAPLTPILPRSEPRPSSQAR
jgi:hypothetical protein